MEKRFIIHKHKKVLAMLMVMLCMVSMSVNVFASETYVNNNYNISTESSEKELGAEISMYGFSKPSKKKYVNLNDEALTFSGHADGSTLYSNKYFTGKSSIGYSITNDSDSKLTVKFYTSSGWVKSKKITVEGNATLTGTISGLDDSKLYYLTFSAPSDFNGSIY